MDIFEGNQDLVMDITVADKENKSCKSFIQLY